MDWRSNVYATIGASDHSKEEREKHDYYSTDPKAVRMLHEHGLLDKDTLYWENACGGGNLSKELLKMGYDVISSDKYDRGYGTPNVDFFDCNGKFEGSILTNPPYSFINDWIVHSLNIATDKVYIFGRIQTIETVKRYDRIFKDNPPVFVCPFVKRIHCYKNDDRSVKKDAVCYSWFIWNNKVDNENTVIKWLI